MPDAETGSGHNSVTGAQLRAFVERIERLHEERKTIADDISDIYAEIKCFGYDGKIIKKLVADRAKDSNKLREEREIYDLYASALGME